MTIRRKISEKVLRLLYAHSGNQCAYPGCCTPIFEDDGLLTADCCHIKAISVGGPRYDAAQTDEERNGVDNLMLLCSRHHKIVDSDEVTYTVEELQKYKQEHEARFSAESLRLTKEQLRFLQWNSESFWKQIEETDKADIVAPDLKIMVDVDQPIDAILKNIEEILNQIKSTFDILGEYDSQLAQQIHDYLVEIGADTTEYDRQSECPYANPFDNPHWEIFALGTHNWMGELWMYYLQLVVRALERISVADGKEHPLLQEYRERLVEHQKHNYYLD